MIISHKYRFIFIKTAKTAGTSIEAYLSRHCGAEDILTPIYPPVMGHESRNYVGFTNPIRDIASTRGKRIKKIITTFLRREKFFNHIPSCLIRSRVPRDVWENYYRFCVERNPWDKTLSHYSMVSCRGKRRLSFDQYIRQGDYCLNYPLYTERGGNSIMVNRLLHYELLSTELEDVFDMLKIPFDGTLNIQAKREYRTDHRPYREVYTKEQRKTIEEAFEKEIALLGYEY